MNIKLLEQAFNSFMKEAFIEAAISSTKASWAGSEYCVELFDDATYRALWGGNIGNLYESNGIILSIPSLNDEDWDGNDENPPYPYTGNAEALMRERFTDYLDSVQNYSTTQG